MIIHVHVDGTIIANAEYYNATSLIITPLTRVRRLGNTVLVLCDLAVLIDGGGYWIILCFGIVGNGEFTFSIIRDRDLGFLNYGDRDLAIIIIKNGNQWLGFHILNEK